MKVYNSVSDTWVDSDTLLIVDKLLKLRYEKSMWEVIDVILDWWIQSNPKKWDAHLVELKNVKATRSNSFASTHDKSLRYMLDIPEKVILIIRKLYSTEECPMDKRWMLKFARRYPRFVVAERL